MEQARLATLHDLDAIGAIAGRIAADLPDKRGGPLFLRRESGGDASRRAEAQLASSQGFVILGTYDDVPFGYAIVDMETLADGGLLARLDDLAVDAEVRGSGIGEAMMNLVMETARGHGCFGIDSRALPGDRHTKNFFESFGLKARLLVVHKSL